MNRLSLILELIGLGFTPPPNVPTDALFDCVDARRRINAGEMAGDPFANPVDAIVIHHPCDGPIKARVAGFPLTDLPGPEIDPWPEGREVARALATLA